MKISSQITPEICNKCCNRDGGIVGKCGLFALGHSFDLNGEITSIYCLNFVPQVEVEKGTYLQRRALEITKALAEIEASLLKIADELEAIEYEDATRRNND